MRSPLRETCDWCARAAREQAGQRCEYCTACRATPEGRAAAQIGRAWAIWVRGQMDVRRPWPDYEGRCRDIAHRLVAWLAHDDVRRNELAHLCWWCAGLRWELVVNRSRDDPWEFPTGGGEVIVVQGYEPVRIELRPRRRRTVDLYRRSTLLLAAPKRRL